jgi:hypothetical protein
MEEAFDPLPHLSETDRQRVRAWLAVELRARPTASAFGLAAACLAALGLPADLEMAVLVEILDLDDTLLADARTEDERAADLAAEHLVAVDYAVLEAWERRVGPVASPEQAAAILRAVRRRSDTEG